MKEAKKQMNFTSSVVFTKGIHRYFFVLFFLLTTVVWAIPVTFVHAQQESPDSPYYVIRPGDSLWDISLRFGIPLEDLELANGITNPDQLTTGMKLTLPGLNGMTGEIQTREIGVGDTLDRLSRRFGIPLDLLIRLNRITSPAESYAGASFLLPAGVDEQVNGVSVSLAPGQSIFGLAVALEMNPWLLRLNNGISADWEVLPGQDLYALKTGISRDSKPTASVTIDPVRLSQGTTVEVKVAGPPGMILKGILGDYELKFFSTPEGYVALQGIHAMAVPGLSSLVIKGQYPDTTQYNGQEFSFSQSLILQSGSYPFDPVLIVNPETIDPAITQPEDELWKSLGTQVTTEKFWEGPFVSPVPEIFKDCWTSLFGNRRSYNNGPYDFFHSGLDFCGQEGTELYAPAGGRVVFADLLTVRGNATVIDHGWGVYTAYDHQSQQFVKVGDVVEPGQLIGLGGATGRVTGPHLHWEVWVGGVQVDPMDWLKKNYP